MAPSSRNGRKWSELSPSYRARLKGAKVTREQWLRGADLRAARGRKVARTETMAPEGPERRLIEGEATEPDVRAIQYWRSHNAPDWITADMSDDVAAALSQLGLPVEKWGSIKFVPAAGGQPWKMTVTPKAHMKKDGTVRTHAYDRTVTIPGGGAKDTPGASEALKLVAGERPDHYDVMGSDGKPKAKRMAAYDRREKYKAARLKAGKTYTRRDKRKKGKK